MAWIKRLFARFDAIWPVWSAGYDADTAKSRQTRDEWAQALHGFDEIAIGQALVACRNTSLYPPSIAEFRAACQAARSDRYAHSAHSDTPSAVASWGERRAVGLRHIGGLMGAVNNTSRRDHD